LALSTCGLLLYDGLVLVLHLGSYKLILIRPSIGNRFMLSKNTGLDIVIILTIEIHHFTLRDVIFS